MGKRRTHKPNKKQKAQRLHDLCIKLFGETYEDWSWVVNSGTMEGYPREVATAIELPKRNIDGDNLYTDPFIGTSGGESKSFIIACDNAIKWIENKLYDYG
tara:strand:- start:784 stop:1086 length:303 start_codon:yes stop_codon:yes gene_type:complete